MLVRRCAAHEAFFSDYARGCASGECQGVCRNAAAGCAGVQAAVIATLSAPGSLLWEVVQATPSGDPLVDWVGILRLSEIVPGCSAKAHYFFFDRRLSDKTDLLLAWKDWAFTPGAAWPGIHRCTVTVPDYARALMRHAVRHLGFVHEGTMRSAILWRGVWRDEHVLGCVADAPEHA